jgi:hypothetical protein
MAIAGVLLGAMPAHAGIIVSVNSVSVAPGTTGAFIEFNITNTGPVQNIAGFNLGVTVAGTDITFTGGDQSTTLTYIFSGDSFNLNNGFPFTTVPPPNGQTAQAGDLSDSGLGNSMNAETLGLGRLSFDVSQFAAGVYSVTIAPDCSVFSNCTSFSDSNFNDVPFTVSNGTITVTSEAPEPSAFLLSLLIVPMIALRRRKGVAAV